MSDDATQDERLVVRCRECAVEWDIDHDPAPCWDASHAHSLNGGPWFDGKGNKVAEADVAAGAGTGEKREETR